MQTIFKIHPGVGVARVGSSRSGYFLAGETVGAVPFELDADGNEMQFTGHKDASKLMRRQGVRFRIFKYLRDDVEKWARIVKISGAKPDQ